MANENLGTARIGITVDMADFDAKVEAARRKTTGLGEEADAAFQKTTGGVTKATQSLLNYVRQMGLSADAQKLLNAEIRGVPAEVIAAARREMEKHAAATAEAARQSAILKQTQANAASADQAHKRMQEALLAERAETERLIKTREDFINRLRSESAAIGKTRADLLEMKAAEMGVTAQAAPFIAALRAQEAALAGQSKGLQQATKEFNKYGLSQKQQVAAMRGVPAQITDIFISLQGGQNPLTVLLQQGGQLKDMFGGLVPAVRALGTALLGLVNPYTVVAGIVGTLLYTYLQVEQRANSFNKALILTGQSSTLAASELQTSVDALDRFANITGREAAGALAQFAATGLVARDNLELLSRAALDMESITGKAVKDTVAEYAEIAKDPVNAILRLNESEHFLTASVYERIKALQESGDIEAAAALAQQTRAQEQIERAREVTESLGLVSGAWHEIKESTGEAFDEAVNYFVQLDKDAKDAAGTLGALIKQYTSLSNIRALAFGNTTAGQQDAGEAAADPAEAAINSRNQRQLDAMLKAARTRDEIYKDELKQIENLARTDVEREKLKAAAKKRYDAAAEKPKGAAGARSLANAEAAAGLQAIKDNLAAEQAAIQNGTRLLSAEYSARLVNVEDYYKRQRELVQREGSAEENALVQQIALLRDRNVTGKDSVTVGKQLGELEAKLIKVRLDNATALKVLGIQEDAVMRQRAAADRQYTQSLDDQLEAARAVVDAQLLRIKAGEAAASQQEQLNKIVAQGIKEEQALLARRENGDLDQGQYETKLEQHREFIRKLLQQTKDGFAEIDAAQGDWLNGMTSGIRDWMKQASDVATQVNGIITGALDGMTDALAEFVITGKSQFKDFFVSLLKEIVNFLAKQAVLNFLKAFGSAYSGAGGWVGVVATAASSYGNAKSAPAGVMPSGGQISSGNGKMTAGGAVSVAIHTTIMQDGSTRTNTTGDQAALDQFGKQMAAVAKQEINNAMRPGGAIWRQKGSTV